MPTATVMCHEHAEITAMKVTSHRARYCARRTWITKDDRIELAQQQAVSMAVSKTQARGRFFLFLNAH